MKCSRHGKLEGCFPILFHLLVSRQKNEYKIQHFFHRWNASIVKVLSLSDKLWNAVGFLFLIFLIFLLEMHRKLTSKHMVSIMMKNLKSCKCKERMLCFTLLLPPLAHLYIAVLKNMFPVRLIFHFVCTLESE